MQCMICAIPSSLRFKLTMLVIATSLSFNHRHTIHCLGHLSFLSQWQWATILSAGSRCSALPQGCLSLYNRYSFLRWRIFPWFWLIQFMKVRRDSLALVSCIFLIIHQRHFFRNSLYFLRPLGCLILDWILHVMLSFLLMLPFTLSTYSHTEYNDKIWSKSTHNNWASCLNSIDH